MADSIALLLLLVGLELVLGIDNILVISILVGRLPESQRPRARFIGLGFALIARLVLLFILLMLSGMTNPVFLNFSVRDLILLAGGLFLLWKGVKEIHHTVELKPEDRPVAMSLRKGFIFVILQIVLLDIVFSIDSVITAIGLTNQMWVIASAVIVSFVAILAFANPVGEFILKRPTLKILALSFLITIGVTIFMEGMHQSVPKAYIYLPMGFALCVEFLQLRYDHNLRKAAQSDTGET
jgi:predicted tellurium resistance membrane protein TerC